jgi:invasion protein IalB
MAYPKINFAKWQRLLPVAILAIGAPLGASAQDAAAPAPAPAPAPVLAPAPSPNPDESPWAKICNKNPTTGQELCLTIQEVKAETGQFIASATIREITGDSKKSFVVAVPPGMLLQPGMRAQIDNGQQHEIPYGVCFPNACYGELEINDDFVNSMKKGSQIVITAMNAQAKPVSFPLTLGGFTKAYDSAGLDPQGLQQRQQELTKALQDRAAKARQKLLEQQQKEGQNN